MNNPPPIPNEQVPVYERVIEDIKQRADMGRQKYGTFLQPFNGRNAAQDAYEEVLDLAQYFRQHLDEGAFLRAALKAHDSANVTEAMNAMPDGWIVLRYGGAFIVYDNNGHQVGSDTSISGALKTAVQL